MLSQSWHLYRLSKGLQTHSDAVKPKLLEHLDAFIPNASYQWDDVYYDLHRLLKKQHADINHLKAQQAHFVEALQASPNACVLLDAFGIVVWLNTAAEYLLGLNATQDTGQHLRFLLRHTDIAQLLNHQSNHTPIQMEIQGRMIKVQALPFGNQQTLLLGQDFTDVAKTEQIRRDFIANVSHELRTPLTVLTGYIEVLQDYIKAQPEHIPKSLHSAIDYMAEHTQRMNHLTHDLLQLAVLDVRHVKEQVLNQDLILIKTLLDSVKTSTLPLIENAKLRLNKTLTLMFLPVFNTLTPLTELSIKGNLQELHSAMSNLITNAIRYTPSNGSITVSVSANNGYVYLSVKDTGCGIEAIHIPRLTERFYRVSRSRGRIDETEGTGLGLAIVKHIMLRHQGELQIISTVGQGSCFTLVLPWVV
jgi:two-component system phosphate regulon sensor histidine kinase PhoR